MTEETFKATLKGRQEVDINELDKLMGTDIGIDIINEEAIVEFRLSPEAREWGIKGISITILRVAAVFQWQAYVEDITQDEKGILLSRGGKEFYGMIEGEYTVPIDDSWDISHELEFAKDGALSVDNISIDLFDKAILIQ